MHSGPVAQPISQASAPWRLRVSALIFRSGSQARRPTRGPGRRDQRPRLPPLRPLEGRHRPPGGTRGASHDQLRVRRAVSVNLQLSRLARQTQRIAHGLPRSRLPRQAGSGRRRRSRIVQIPLCDGNTCPPWRPPARFMRVFERSTRALLRGTCARLFCRRRCRVGCTRSTVRPRPRGAGLRRPCAGPRRLPLGQHDLPGRPSSCHLRF